MNIFGWLPWKFTLEKKTPTPTWQLERDAIIEGIGKLEDKLDEVAKMAEATRRKVYRDEAKGEPLTTEQLNALYAINQAKAPPKPQVIRTGDPAEE